MPQQNQLQSNQDPFALAGELLIDSAMVPARGGRTFPNVNSSTAGRANPPSDTAKGAHLYAEQSSRRQIVLGKKQ
jgi:hypothetical protein